MSEADKYMDEQFRKMSEEFQASYQSSFWEDALAQLENDSLDDAFRTAAAQTPIMPSFELGAEGLSEVFMDEAFRDAAQESHVAYDPSFWQDLEAARPDLTMDEAYSDAANNVVANYSPVFWGDANSALEKEGLHFEYQSAYWDEARTLLDKADRKLFFSKWTAVAIVLLLISFAGLQGDFNLNVAKENSLNGIETIAPITSVDELEAEVSPIQNVGLNALTEEEVSQGNLSENTTHSSTHNTVHAPTQNTNHSTLDSDSPADLVDNDQNESPNSPINPAGDNELENNGATTGHENELPQSDLVDENPSTDNNEEETNSDLPDPIVAQVEENEINTEESNPLRLEKNNENEAQFAVVENRINYLSTPIKLLQLRELTPDFEEVDLGEIKAFEPKPIHTVSLTGYVGLGQNFGANTYLFTKRFGGAVEYVFTGAGSIRGGIMNHLEFGGSLGLNYVESDGLGIENQVTLFKENGEIEKYWRNLQVFDLYYASANAFVNYRFNNHHRIRIGAGVDHLVAVQSNMAYRKDDDKGIQTVNNNWGVKDGLTVNDLKFSCGYEVNVNRSWAFQLMFTTGLKDRTDNTFFNELTPKTVERNLTLGIRYTLFNKL